LIGGVAKSPIPAEWAIISWVKHRKPRYGIDNVSRS
jgi:hypothetical protein